MNPHRFPLAIAPHRRRVRLPAVSLLVAWALCLTAVVAASDSPAEQPPILYSSPEAHDAVSRLQERIDRGEVALTFDARHGYLKSVLAHLDVPASSQGLVFSKTSFQRTRIAPATPRAVYFGDDVYVGWVQQGEVLEFSAVDPQKGALFYTLSQAETPRPRFVRQTHNCLQCHESSRTQGVPGHLVRSVYSDARGQPLLSAGSFVTGHESPLRARWGGWYVTGTHGAQRHLGNLLVEERDQRVRPEALDLDPGANRATLDGLVETAPYLTPDSDLVALMVLEHQTQMHNLLCRANHLTRLALRDEEVINRALGRTPADHLDSTKSRIKSAGEPLVRYLLFADEALLTAPVAGTTPFAREFAARGRRDSKGRSLRDLDLGRRLFRYPCSYLIDSEAFHRQPDELKQYVYGRLKEILRSDSPAPGFESLTGEERAAVDEILLETQSNLPDDWRE